MFIELFLSVEHLKEKLDDYIKMWNGLVKVFRNERREGLIQARSIGAQKAKLGQVRASDIYHINNILDLAAVRSYAFLTTLQLLFVI